MMTDCQASSYTISPIGMARAYVWQKWIDEGTYGNAKELAQDINMDPAVVRRIMRLGSLSPGMVEGAVYGCGSDVSLQGLLAMEVTVEWGEQESLLNQRQDNATEII